MPIKQKHPKLYKNVSLLSLIFSCFGMWKFKNTESKSLNLQPHRSSLNNSKHKNIHENMRWLLHVCIRMQRWLHEHTLSFFPAWYHWTPNVQFQVLWKTSSLNISQCALKVIVCFWNHIPDVSAPHLYNRNYTSSQRSHEEELELAKVPQWCAGVAIVICQRKDKEGNSPPVFVCIKA